MKSASENEKRMKFYGMWADLHRDYLMEYQPEMWNRILKEEEEEAYLTAFEEKMQEKADKLEREMAPQYGLTEDLKARDPMAWVGTYNNLRATIRELLQEDLYPQATANEETTEE